MKREKSKKILCLLFALVLIFGCLSGCGKAESEGEDNSDTVLPEPIEEENTAPTYDDRFTLNCSGNGSYNPFTIDSSFDKDVTTFIYDSLFVLNESFEPESDICIDAKTTDGKSYDFTLQEGITMHNGSLLDAEDVAYSINMARSSQLYSKRLYNVESCYATGDYTFKMTLYTANFRLPSLLDIPIVAYGTGEDSNPVGSGPYMLGSGGDTLVPFENYRRTGFTVVDTIYLETYSEGALGTAFIGHDLELIHMQANKIDDLNIRTICERGDFNTTTLQYIGFNMTNSLTAESSFRRAVSHLVDREYIVDMILNDSAIEAPLMLSSAMSGYQEEWEEGKTYSVETAKKLLEGLEVQDTDNNGYLEYHSVVTVEGAEGEDPTYIDEGYKEYDLSFIVNEEDQYKVRTAEVIADALDTMGFRVTVRSLPWEEYVSALESGSYDMYYAEARVTADFNLSPFVSENGYLNYSGVENEALIQYNESYMGSSGETALKRANTLCTAFYRQSPVVPVVYEKESVLTHWGTVTDMNYSQSGIFYSGGSLCTTPEEE